MTTFKQFLTERVIFKGEDYYAQAFNFFLNKHGVDAGEVNVVIVYRDNFKKKDGLVIPSQQMKNGYMVHIGKDHPPADMLRVLAHEAKHVEQMHNGRLMVDIGRNAVYWNGEEVDINKVPYRRRPFEIEAFAAEKQFIHEFIEQFGNNIGE